MDTLLAPLMKEYVVKLLTEAKANHFMFEV
jgi:hypothetical protein